MSVYCHRTHWPCGSHVLAMSPSEKHLSWQYPDRYIYACEDACLSVCHSYHDNGVSNSIIGPPCTELLNCLYEEKLHTFSSFARSELRNEGFNEKNSESTAGAEPLPPFSYGSVTWRHCRFVPFQYTSLGVCNLQNTSLDPTRAVTDDVAGREKCPSQRDLPKDICFNNKISKFLNICICINDFGRK